jgi:serine/threonine protein kinase/cytochrome c-type biogenesis protein CcmH/NrfG
LLVMVLEQVGAYKIVSRLGKGGMATIYKGSSPKGETVAIKVISGEFVQRKEFVKRFSRETQIYNSLNHPGIVRIRDSGIQDDQYYVVMDLIPGKSLDAILTPGQPSDVPWAVEMMAQVLDALQTAHVQGIVHRDLKPGNIIVTPEGRPVLLDFGIAFVTNATAITQEGNFLGTPAYVAPEMVRGGDTTTPAFDLYSVGIILYEMVAGRLPFESESPMGTLFKHMQEQATRPRVFNQAIPRKLENVILRALDKDPLRRASSASQMAADLREAVLEDPHAPQRTLDESERAVKSSERSTLPELDERPMKLRTLDLAPSDLPSLHPAMSEAFVLYQDGKYSRAQELLANLITSSADEDLSSQVQFLRGLLAWQSRDYSMALDLLMELRLKWPDSSKVWPARLLVARCYYERRDLYEALREFKSILDHCPEAGLKQDAMIGLEAATYLYIQDGETKLTAGDLASAREVFSRIRELWLKDKGNPLYRSMWLGVAEQNLLKCDHAEEVGDKIKTREFHATQTVRSRRRLAGVSIFGAVVIPVAALLLFKPDLPYLFQIRLYQSRGDIAGEVSALEKILTYRPNAADLWARLGHLRLSLNRTTIALEALEHSLKLDPGNEALALETAGIEEKSGAIDAARQTLQNLCDLQPKSERPYLELVRLNIAVGHRQQAVNELESYLKRAPQSAPAWKTLGQMRLDSGNLMTALEALTRAQSLTPEDTQVALALAEVYFRQNDFSRALIQTHKVTDLPGAPAVSFRLQAAVLLKSGDKERAVASLEAACLRGTVTSKDWIEVAQGWETLAQPTRALSAYMQANTLQPKQPKVLLRLAQIHQDLNMNREAVNFYDELVGIPAERTPANLLMLAQEYLNTEAIDRVPSVLAELKRMCPRCADELEGDLAVKRDDLAAALEAYERVLQQPKPPPAVARKMGSLLMKRKEFIQAIDYFRRALEINAADKIAWDKMGWCWLQMEENSQAIDAFREAVRLDPKSFEIRLHLGVAFKNAGQKENAIRELQISLALAPHQDNASQVRKLINSLRSPE